MNLQGAMMAGQGKHANNPGASVDLILHIDKSLKGDDGWARQTCQHS
jgi:hypothetical protein